MAMGVAAPRSTGRRNHTERRNTAQHTQSTKVYALLLQALLLTPGELRATRDGRRFLPGNVLAATPGQRR